MSKTAIAATDQRQTGCKHHLALSSGAGGQRKMTETLTESLRHHYGISLRSSRSDDAANKTHKPFSISTYTARLATGRHSFHGSAIRYRVL